MHVIVSAAGSATSPASVTDIVVGIVTICLVYAVARRLLGARRSRWLAAAPTALTVLVIWAVAGSLGQPTGAVAKPKPSPSPVHARTVIVREVTTRVVHSGMPSWGIAVVAIVAVVVSLGVAASPERLKPGSPVLRLPGTPPAKAGEHDRRDNEIERSKRDPAAARGDAPPSAEAAPSEAPQSPGDPDRPATRGSQPARPGR